MIYEYFNTSNQTSPFAQRHENFVVDLRSPGCAIVQTHDYPERCNFVKNTFDCSDGTQIINYPYVFYCGLNAQNKYTQALGIFVVFCWVFYLTTAIGIIADVFFCPTLNMLTKNLGISQNLAGITLLSIGNSGPDLVSFLSGIGGGYIGTQYSGSMGTAIFDTALVAGVIIYIRPLKVEPLTFVRDVGFQLLSVTYIDYAIDSDRFVTVNECIIMLGIYVLYMIIVAVDQLLLVRQIRYLKALKLKQRDSFPETLQKRLDVLIEEAESSIPEEDEITSSSVPYEHLTKCQLHLKQVRTTLQPFTAEEWNEAGRWGKIWILLQAPMNLILFAMLPTVDTELELNGWSKLMNCLQIVLLPQGIAYVVAQDMNLFGFQLWYILLICTVPVSVVFLIVTQVDQPPDFHFLFGIVSLIGSMMLIRIISLEINNLVNLLGYITLYSQSFLGCTILAWGDSLGDIVSSIEFAKQGFQKMSFAACIAGPFLFLTMGLAMTYMYRAINTPTLPPNTLYVGEVKNMYAASQGSMGETCLVFLNITLLVMLFGAAMTNFYIRRSLGVHLIIIYVLFCVYCLLGENQIIHAFGTDHYEDVSIFFL